MSKVGTETFKNSNGSATLQRLCLNYSDWSNFVDLSMEGRAQSKTLEI
jgi:hypothetical protein